MNNPLMVRIGGLAEIVGKRFSPQAVAWYASECKRIGEREAIRALEHFARKGRWPSIEEIELLVSGKGDTKSEATAIAGEIWGAVARFGSVNEIAASRALGPVAWRAVQRYGGWSELCAMPVDARTSVVAQLRDIITGCLASEESQKMLAPHLTKALPP